MLARPAHGPWKLHQLAIVLWGVGGVLLLLAQAVWRLSPIALEPIVAGMSPVQLTALVCWILVNGYAEGYRAFQKRFSPRVAARAVHLARHPRFLYVLFAPLFCMSFVHATRRGRITAWGVTLGVATAVLLIRLVPQPWRGILDAGVVVGLLWGAVTLVTSTLQNLRGHPSEVDLELPTSSTEARRSDREPPEDPAPVEEPVLRALKRSASRYDRTGPQDTP